MTISNEAREAAAELYNDGWPDTLTVSHVIQLAIDKAVAAKCKPLLDTLTEFHYAAERHSKCYPENKCAACVALTNHTKPKGEKE